MNYLRRRAPLPVTGFDTVKGRREKRRERQWVGGVGAKAGGGGNVRKKRMKAVGGWMEGRRERKEMK